MFQKYILIIIVFFSLLMAKDLRVEQDSTKSLIFKIFSLDDKDTKKYEKGYIFDRVFKRREFHKPVNFIPMELRYGFGYNSGGGFLGMGSLNSSWMNYDSDITEFKGGPFRSRFGHQLDLDIMKTNLAYYWFGNSWLDMHTGLNLRYSSLLAPSETPPDWSISNESWKEGLKFNAKVYEVGWSQSLILQWFESWYTTYRYTYGIAFSQFYEKESKPTGSGPSQSLGIGARYIIDNGLTNRFSIGLDLKYTNTSIKNINDPRDITPISSFKIQTLGIYASAAVFFGGQKTKGDIGKSHYYSKNYILAKSELEEFVDEYPNHANIKSAKKLIVESERKIPYQLMREGMSFDERGITERAVERYIRAKSVADTLLKGVVDERLREIAFKEVEKAENWLNQGFGDSAITHVTNISGWYPDISHHIKRFKINYLMMQGEQLYKAGLYNRSLFYFDQALKIDSNLTFEIGTFKHRIAVDLLTLADSLKDINSLKFVVYALEETQSLTGGLNKTNKKVLEELKNKLIAKEEYEIRQKIDDILLNDKRRKESINPIKLGMMIYEVEKIMGNPSELVKNGLDDKNQLWIYRFDNRKELYLTFTNYKLFRIEEK
jgi:tetratricopeptide (TPR) repeat protein